jgi:hypothetical protein
MPENVAPGAGNDDTNMYVRAASGPRGNVLACIRRRFEHERNKQIRNRAWTRSEPRGEPGMQLTAEELAELRENFDYNDLNKDGKIELGEFVSMLQELESGTEFAEARLGFRDIDTDKDGAIEFDEFIEWWLDK